MSVGAGFKSFLCGWWPFILSVVVANNFLRVSVFLSVGPAQKKIALKFLVRLEPFIHLVVTENNYSTCRFGFCVSL